MFYPNTTDDVHASAIRVEAGADVRGVDFLLTKVESFSVKGTVIDEQSRQPIARASVNLIPKRGEWLGARTLKVSKLTDAAGNFEFRAVGPGSYTLSTVMTSPGFNTIFDQQDIEVSRSVSDLRAALRPYPSVKGRIVVEGGGAIPLNKTILTLNNFAGTEYGTGAAEDGTFELSNLIPGVFRLELAGFPDNFFIRSARLSHRDALQDGVDLTEKSADSLEVVVAGTGALVEGVVTDAAASVAGVQVVLVPASARRERPDLFKTATTDHSGRFTIRGVVPGSYKLFAWKELDENAFFDPAFMEQYESQGKSIRLDENGRLSVTLTAIP